MEVNCKTKGFKLLAIWIVSVAVLALIYFVVVFPIYLAVNHKEIEVAKMSEDVDRIRIYVSDQNFKRVQEQARDLTGGLDGFVSNGLMATRCTYVISDIAGKTGASDFTTKQKTPKALSQIQNCQMLKAAHVEVSCKGSYLKFLNLINEYERSRPIVLIDKFSITVFDDGQNEINMSLLVLVDKQDEPL
jgi:hypothetical protein